MVYLNQYTIFLRELQDVFHILSVKEFSYIVSKRINGRFINKRLYEILLTNTKLYVKMKSNESLETETILLSERKKI